MGVGWPRTSRKARSADVRVKGEIGIGIVHEEKLCAFTRFAQSGNVEARQSVAFCTRPSRDVVRLPFASRSDKRAQFHRHAGSRRKPGNVEMSFLTSHDL